VIRDIALIDEDVLNREAAEIHEFTDSRVHCAAQDMMDTLRSIDAIVMAARQDRRPRLPVRLPTSRAPDPGRSTDSAGALDRSRRSGDRIAD
jgi:hypothetical protein